MFSIRTKIMINGAYQKNKLIINGEILSDYIDIKENVANVFHGILSESEVWRPNINRMTSEPLSEERINAPRDIIFQEEGHFNLFQFV